MKTRMTRWACHLLAARGKGTRPAVECIVRVDVPTNPQQHYLVLAGCVATPCYGNVSLADQQPHIYYLLIRT